MPNLKSPGSNVPVSQHICLLEYHVKSKPMPSLTCVCIYIYIHKIYKAIPGFHLHTVIPLGRMIKISNRQMFFSFETGCFSLSPGPFRSCMPCMFFRRTESSAIYGGSQLFLASCDGTVGEAQLVFTVRSIIPIFCSKRPFAFYTYKYKDIRTQLQIQCFYFQSSYPSVLPHS